MKNILFRTSCTFLLCLFTIVANAQSLTWIPFKWSGDSVSGKYFDKYSIMIPLKINDIPANFNMQFDLGAVTTVIYGKSIKPYLNAYPALKSKIDTSKKFFIQGNHNPMFTGMELKMGATSFKDIDIGYFENFGSSIDPDSILSKSEKHIGTIGPDLFKNKILIIDYPNNRIGVCQELPKRYKLATFQSFKSDDGRIKIPLTIDGQIQYLLFDTGSSLFTLTTSKKNALKTADAKIADSLSVMSWGNKLTFYGLKTNKAIMFANKVLNGSLVYFDEKETFGDFYKAANIWGLTGNIFFLNNTVIIDYKNKLFGVL